MADVEQERTALIEAMHHVERAMLSIAEQERRIAELRRDGHDVAVALDSLATLRATLQKFEAYLAHMLERMTPKPHEPPPPRV